MRKKNLILLAIVTLLLFLITNYSIKNLYKSNTVTVRLTNKNIGCNAEDALFKIDSISTSSETNNDYLLGQIVLPVFKSDAKRKYDMIYKMKDSVYESTDSVTTIIVTGRRSFFSNVPESYGCKGAYSFEITDIIEVE